MTKRLGLVGALVAALIAPAVGSQAASDGTNAHASVTDGVITVGGNPLFPVMLLDQCGKGAAANAASLGVNVILNESCPAQPRRQLSSLQGGQLGILPIGGRAVHGGSLLGWTYPDEPDNNKWTPEALLAAFAYPEGSPDGLLSFLTTSSLFYTAADRRDAAARAAGFAAIADVPGFDLYPLNHCRTNLVEVYDAQRRFARIARGKPTFQWIETGAIRPGYCGGLHVTPAEVTAEAWLAVAGGARGVGFFTHTWSPEHSEFAVAGPVQGAIRQFAATAAAVRPGLTGTTTDTQVNTPAIRLLARVGGGLTYVFAVNTLTSPVPAVITVPHLRAQSLSVVGEGRSVAVHGRRFADTFTPLGVHVYVESS